VHHDADWAVVRIAVTCVKVSHLHHSQQREQNEAHKGHKRQGVEACTAICGPLCTQSWQLDTFPTLKIHRFGQISFGFGCTLDGFWGAPLQQTLGRAPRLN
jgi:hypothetical protein